MKLSTLDDKCVRVTTEWGDTFEGACQHFSEEYALHEFGVEEEGLQIACWVFYASQIAAASEINCDEAFLSSYGKLEEETVADGFALAEEILLGEDERNTRRLLNYLLEHHASVPDREDYLPLLRKLDSFYDDEAVLETAARLSGLIERDVQ